MITIQAYNTLSLVLRSEVVSKVDFQALPSQACAWEG